MKRALIAASFLLGGTAFAHEVIHADHGDLHAAGDGHLTINHNGHVDHLHDGHLHHVHGDHVIEHVLEVTAANPVSEEIVRHVNEGGHVHEKGGAHPRIQHGEHFDYIHNGRLHFMHGDHVDDHGAISIVK